MRMRIWARSLGRMGPFVAALVLMSVCALGLYRQNPGDACRSNLKQYALGIIMYTQDYDEKFPPTKQPAQVEHRVWPYIKNKSVFTCPDTGANYLPNPALNYVNSSSIQAPAQTVMLRDAKAHTVEGGSSFWNAAYTDGHVKQLSTEPALGKAPPDPTHAQIVAERLQLLRQEQKNFAEMIRKNAAEIRKLEAEQRRLSRAHRK